MHFDNHISDKESKSTEIHRDDLAVDRFATAMKEKLSLAREKGRSGWEQCDPAELSRMLVEHVGKGDPRDVANFCMFLWSLGQPITPYQTARVAEPVAEVVETKMAAWSKPHADVKWFKTDFEVGTKFYTTHQPAPFDIKQFAKLASKEMEKHDFHGFEPVVLAVVEKLLGAQPAPEFKGWYCAHCQRGVDGSEVTFNEQHQVCGRVITDDVPPAQPAPDVDELVKAAAEVLRISDRKHDAWDRLRAELAKHGKTK